MFAVMFANLCSTLRHYAEQNIEHSRVPTRKIPPHSLTFAPKSVTVYPFKCNAGECPGQCLFQRAGGCCKPRKGTPEAVAPKQAR